MTSRRRAGWPGESPERGGYLTDAPVDGPPACADVAVVILTLGKRPSQLARAIESVRAQHGVRTEILVVWNGLEPDRDLGDAVRNVALDVNVGIPEGRNRGVSLTSASFVLFLDDDAVLIEPDTVSAMVERMAGDPRLAVVSPRIVDEAGNTARRHIPRLGQRGLLKSGPVTAFLGGVSLLRRQAFDDVGGYEGELFYAMEETDLSWRLVDDGWTLWYAADLQVLHPKTAPERHPGSIRRTARNRLWIAHRLLPAPVAMVYLSNWFLIAAVRDPGTIREVIGGYRTGWAARIGPRSPIRWRTVLRLTRLGRPPIV